MRAADDARAEMRRVLENQFWPFLAHDPHDPERFWGLAVDAVMDAADRAETTTVTDDLKENRPMARKLTMGGLIDVVEAVMEAEYGGFHHPVAKRVVTALNDEGVFDPTQVEGWEA